MAQTIKYLLLAAAGLLFDAHASVQVCALTPEDSAAGSEACDGQTVLAPAVELESEMASQGFKRQEQRLKPAELTGAQRVLVREGIKPSLDDPRARFGVMVGNSILREGSLHHIAVCGFVELPSAADTQRGGQLFYGWLLPKTQRSWTFVSMPFSTSAETQATIARLCAEDGVST